MAHGAATLMRVSAGRLHAATELGDRLAWDLGAFDLGWCELLAQVWKAVPVVWEGGPRVQPPPVDHPCRRTP